MERDPLVRPDGDPHLAGRSEVGQRLCSSDFSGEPSIDAAAACAFCWSAFADYCGFLLFQNGLSRRRLDAPPARHLQERYRECLRCFECAAEPRRDADNHRFPQRAEYMRPSFPTLTFPNHWTLLTGLYPSVHGIVANDFYDPAVDKEFVYTEPSKSWDSDWWSGEPVRLFSSRRESRAAN